MGKKLKLGLKLWSLNTDMSPFAAKLYKNKVFDYLELYTIPGTYESTIEIWKSVECPFIIHAPHNAHGFNLARKDLKVSNLNKFKEAKDFCRALKSPWIIVHGGNSGTIEETILQFRELDDDRILVENKPKKGHQGQDLIGYSAEDIKRICREAGIRGVVLDFSHAICAANSLRKDPVLWVKSFLGLPIEMFHLGDGDINSEVDTHRHFGQGSFPVRELISDVPDGAMISVETQMDPKNFLKDVEADLDYLRNLCEAGEKVL